MINNSTSSYLMILILLVIRVLNYSINFTDVYSRDSHTPPTVRSFPQ